MRCTDYYAVAQALDEKLDRDTLEYLDMRDEERREREDEGDDRHQPLVGWMERVI